MDLMQMMERLRDLAVRGEITSAQYEHARKRILYGWPGGEAGADEDAHGAGEGGGSITH